MKGLQAALEDEPEWRDVSARLRQQCPAAREEQWRPFVFAFGYALIPKSDTDRRVREGGPFGAANRVGEVPFPPPLADIEERDVEAWAAAADVLTSSVAISRLGDLLWERRRQPRPDLYARSAIDGYLAVSGIASWHATARARGVLRAIELAAAVGDRDRAGAVHAHAVEFARHSIAEGRGPGVALSLLTALADLRAAERPDELADLLNATDQQFGEDPFIHQAIGDLLVQIDPDASLRIREDQVATWREQATRGDTIMRVMRLERALDLARNHGLTTTADEIRRELQDIRPEDLETQPITATLELSSGEVDAYIATITDAEDWRESLRQFGSVPPPGGSAEDINAALAQERSDFPLLGMFSRSVMGHETAATRYRAGEGADRERLEHAERRAWCARMWSPFAVRALSEIEAVHGRPAHAELAEFFATNLIGSERGERLARSLELFWDAQPDESAHVLVPRLEAVIRELARQAGLTIIREPVGSEPGGVRTLGILLSELKEHFPDPPWDDYLSNLLCDQFGLNLRNTIAHGLSARTGRGDAALLLHAACHLRHYGVNDALPAARSPDA